MLGAEPGQPHALPSSHGPALVAHAQARREDIWGSFLFVRKGRIPACPPGFQLPAGTGVSCCFRPRDPVPRGWRGALGLTSSCSALGVHGPGPSGYGTGAREDIHVLFQPLGGRCAALGSRGGNCSSLELKTPIMSSGVNSYQKRTRGIESYGRTGLLGSVYESRLDSHLFSG
ncbi:unnamed protein product [Rangifer tarandus platyrhynchus]|uniref:Uncharacterized protein n=2 Tax=Rangifer tarandus platyrhynchus TaxID=3082113 RepID=A0ACB0EG80_RANTA|nr:unnamed protein product [Rangifer tarandus platyrhynchus]CAI9699650.1 unnamed protein product [Rangifer tarandus platyrhynchus]